MSTNVIATHCTLKHCKNKYRRLLTALTLIGGTLALLSACGGSGSDSTVPQTNIVPTAAPPTTPLPVTPINSATDTELRALIAAEGLSGDPSIGRTIPSIDSPLAQLGRDLFFSKSLGGGFDAACVTCHHPNLGGADGLSLPVGVDAINADLLGPGRAHTSGLPPVPRNSPSILNIAMWDSGLFFDSRVESIGKEFQANGAGSGIRTPDVAFGNIDNTAGSTLVAAQARFPVTSADEMKTSTFENGSSNEAIRAHLAARIGNYGVGAGELGPNTWINDFQTAFNSTDVATQLITYNNIAQAIGEYERSMVFVDNPWRAYVNGDNDSLTEQQKEGALLFFTEANQGGGGCSSCHSGDFFTDESHRLVAFPQFGPGKGDGNDDDFGRERETGNINDRYTFRTPSLLNVEVTAPYGHAGTYTTLNDVLNHYNNPNDSVNDFFNDEEWCDRGQFSSIENCGGLYPTARANSQQALQRLDQRRGNGDALFENTNLNNGERNDLVAFLRALTDPCVQDPECMAPWVANNGTTGPDGNQLNAVDGNGSAL